MLNLVLMHQSLSVSSLDELTEPHDSVSTGRRFVTFELKYMPPDIGIGRMVTTVLAEHYLNQIGIWVT